MRGTKKVVDNDNTRKVGVALGLGIFFLPPMFSWFVLRKGHTTLARVLGLGWAGLFLITWITSDRQPQQQNVGPIAVTHEASASASVATAPRQQPAARQSHRPDPVEKPLDIGDRFKLGGFAYVVTKVGIRRSIGNQFTRVKASEGATFLIVEYKIENLGNETVTVMADDFRLIDAKGRKYHPSSEANTALMMSGNNKDFLVSQIQPGLKRKMSTAFELPKSSAKQGLKLIIPEKGLLSAGKAEIALKMN